MGIWLAEPLINLLVEMTALLVYIVCSVHIVVYILLE